MRQNAILPKFFTTAASSASSPAVKAHAPLDLTNLLIGSGLDLETVTTLYLKVSGLYQGIIATNTLSGPMPAEFCRHLSVLCSATRRLALKSLKRHMKAPYPSSSPVAADLVRHNSTSNTLRKAMLKYAAGEHLGKEYVSKSFSRFREAHDELINHLTMQSYI